MQSPSNQRFLSSYALRWNSSVKAFEMVQFDQLAFPASNLGAMHGATLVERVRTFGRKIPDIKLHKDRLHAGLKALGIQGSSFMVQIDSALEQLIASSATLLNQESDAAFASLSPPATTTPEPNYRDLSTGCRYPGTN